jgi:2-deoxy-D-gluconate 3-dehydrogenase
MTAGLDGKVALVTGASRGLGAEMAVGLARSGAIVVAAARSAAQLAVLAGRTPDRIIALHFDAGDPASAESLVDRAVAVAGRLDIVVNNAGIAPAGDILEQDPALWRRVMEVNVIAPMMIARTAARQMIAQGTGGKIINIASGTGVRGKPGLVAYSASKGALTRMTEAMAAELARHNIQVNCIAPGAFRTEAQQAVTQSPELLHRRTRRIPARRMADPAEIVPLTLLLASPGSEFITGSIVVIDGGEVGKL